DGHDPAQRRPPALFRHHLHHHAGRSGQCLQYAQHLRIPRRLRILPVRLCERPHGHPLGGRARRRAGAEPHARGRGVVDALMRASYLSDPWIGWLNTHQLALAGLIVMTPTVWMVLSSFKPSYEVTAYPPT